MICENCGKEHDGSFGSGRFCCKECARAFSTRNDNNKELKEAKCIKCGKIIYINKRSSIKKCLCDKCKKQDLYYKKIHKRNICKICGRLKNENNECENNFCKHHNY